MKLYYAESRTDRGGHKDCCIVRAAHRNEAARLANNTPQLLIEYLWELPDQAGEAQVDELITLVQWRVQSYGSGQNDSDYVLT